MSRKTMHRAGLLLALCGLIAGILTASSLASTSRRQHVNTQPPPGERPGWPAFDSAGPVHSEAVVLDEAGTAYITETLDSGTVESASAVELTIREGTTAMPYGTVALKIPAAATVTRNGSEAALGEFESGDFVTVSRSSDGTYIYGGDSEGQGWFGAGNWGPGDRNLGPGGGNWGLGGGEWHRRGPWSAHRSLGPWGLQADR